MDVLKCVFFFPNMDTLFMANIIPQIGVCILLTIKTHPFYFWTHPLYKTTLYTNDIQYPTILPFLGIFKTHPF